MKPLPSMKLITYVLGVLLCTNACGGSAALEGDGTQYFGRQPSFDLTGFGESCQWKAQRRVPQHGRVAVVRLLWCEYGGAFGSSEERYFVFVQPTSGAEEFEGYVLGLLAKHESLPEPRVRWIDDATLAIGYSSGEAEVYVQRSVADGVSIRYNVATHGS